MADQESETEDLEHEDLDADAEPAQLPPDVEFDALRGDRG